MPVPQHTSHRAWRRLMLLCGLALLLAAGQPLLWSWVHEQAIDFHSRRSHAEQLAYLIARVEAVRAGAASHQAAVGELATIAPTEQGMVAAIETIEALAAGLGVTLEVDALSEPSATPVALEELTISLAAAGEPGQLLALVDGIERLPYLTRLGQLRLEPAKPGARLPGRFFASLEVAFFVQSAL